MVLLTSICMATPATSESGAASEDEIISEEDNRHPTTIDTWVHGGSNGCAIVSSGEIICWGRAFTLDDQGIVSVKLPLGKKAIEISVGQGHVCAVLDDSSLTCWGSNEHGQLGDGTYERSNVPIEVSVIQQGSVVKSVSVGSGFTCALLGNHTVFCWGNSDFHKLGGEIIKSGAISTAYVNIPGNESVLSVSSGSAHSCALTSGGQLYCWGNGDDGRLGNGQYGHSLPDLVEFPPEAGAVSGFDLGLYHTCAIVAGSDAYCSGSNTDGQLDGQISTYTSGDSTLRNSQYRYSPESKTPVGEPLKDIKAGRFHTCGLGQSGSVYCWGGYQYNGGGGYGLPNASIFQIDVPGVIDDWTPYCLKTTTDSIYCTDFYQRCVTCAFSYELLFSIEDRKQSSSTIDTVLDLAINPLFFSIILIPAAALMFSSRFNGAIAGIGLPFIESEQQIKNIHYSNWKRSKGEVFTDVGSGILGASLAIILGSGGAVIMMMGVVLIASFYLVMATMFLTGFVLLWMGMAVGAPFFLIGLWFFG